MRMLICRECLSVFNEEDAAIKSECVGEFWGAPAIKEYNACPFCGSIEVEKYYESEEGEEE